MCPSPSGGSIGPTAVTNCLPLVSPVDIDARGIPRIREDMRGIATRYECLGQKGNPRKSACSRMVNFVLHTGFDSRRLPASNARVIVTLKSSRSDKPP